MFLVKLVIALFFGALQCNAQSQTNTNLVEFNQRSEDPYCKSVEEDYDEEPQFACHDRKNAGWAYRYCILLSQRCDCRKTCKDGSDEQNCEAEYEQKGLVPCSDGYRCYRTSQRCDCRRHCRDGSDEEGCPTDNCNICSDGRTTYTDSQICNCRRDCPDGADERNCPNNPGAQPYHCRNGKCVWNGRCNGERECSSGEDEQGCGRSIQCYHCSSVINVGGSYNLREECVEGRFRQEHRTKTCYNYCTLTVKALNQRWGTNIVVSRDCAPLERSTNKRVNRNSCYNMKVLSDVRRLLNTGDYRAAVPYDVYQVQTCNTRFCNNRLGYDFNLCGDVGVGALKARISSAQSIVPSTFSYYLAIVLGYCPIIELYGIN